MQACMMRWRQWRRRLALGRWMLARTPASSVVCRPHCGPKTRRTCRTSTDRGEDTGTTETSVPARTYRVPHTTRSIHQENRRNEKREKKGTKASWAKNLGGQEFATFRQTLGIFDRIPTEVASFWRSAQNFNFAPILLKMDFSTNFCICICMKDNFPTKRFANNFPTVKNLEGGITTLSPPGHDAAGEEKAKKV